MNTNWSKMKKLQIETFGRYFAKMEFESFGFKVYSSEFNISGNEFIAKREDGLVIEIQIKTLLNSSEYTSKNLYSVDISNINMHIILLLFKDGTLPESYLIPAMAWKFPNELLIKTRNYEEISCGISLNNRKRGMLEEYRMEKMLKSLEL